MVEGSFPWITPGPDRFKLEGGRLLYLYMNRFSSEDEVVQLVISVSSDSGPAGTYAIAPRNPRSSESYYCRHAENGERLGAVRTCLAPVNLGRGFEIGSSWDEHGHGKGKGKGKGNGRWNEEG